MNRRERPAEALVAALAARRRGPAEEPHHAQTASLRVALNSLFWGQEGAGSGQYLHNLLPSLAHLQPSASYVLLGPAAGPAPARDVEAPWPRQVLRTPFDGRNENLAKVWFEQVAYPRACRRIGADVAHVPYFAPPLFPRCPPW